jgi:HK97 family phage portal protein
MRWPWIRRSRIERALPQGAQLLGLSGGSPFTASGETVTSERALRVSALWGCVNLLAGTISSLPIHCYRGDDEVPTPRLLQEPSANTMAHDFLYAVMQSLLLRGNCYGLITARSGAGMLPSQVELVSPDRVGVTLDAETQRVIYRIGGVEFSPEDVWHVKAFTSPGAILGMSPVAYAAETIGVGLAAQAYGAEFFASPVPVGTLNVEDNPASPWDEDSQEAVANVWRRWRDQGRKRGTVPILRGVKFEPVAIAPEESQFIESQRFTVAQIARIYNVQPELIGSDAGNSMTYSNVEARALDFLRYSLTPWLVRLDAALGALLPSTLSVKLNADSLLRATTAERYAAHKVGLEAGFLTIDEVRELEDLPPLPRSPAASVVAPSGNGGAKSPPVMESVT